MFWVGLLRLLWVLNPWRYGRVDGSGESEVASGTDLSPSRLRFEEGHAVGPAEFLRVVQRGLAVLQASRGRVER